VLRNLWRTLTTGARFEWPQPAVAAPAAAASVAAPSDDWYVGEKELADFRWTIEEGGRPEGASDWEPLMQKEWPGCTYTAWRRTLPNGKSEYKSVTLAGARQREWGRSKLAAGCLRCLPTRVASGRVC
jgi:hypothetical protein